MHSHLLLAQKRQNVPRQQRKEVRGQLVGRLVAVVVVIVVFFLFVIMVFMIAKIMFVEDVCTCLYILLLLLLMVFFNGVFFAVQVRLVATTGHLTEK